jgi:hypothetical protein
MPLYDTMGVSKREQIAVAMKDMGYNTDQVEGATSVPRTRIDKLKAPLVSVNRALITGMLVEAYEIAETANEVVNVAKELGKLHGLYEPEKTVTLNVSSGDINKQLQQMSTEELQRLLGTPSDEIILEGEYSES